MSDAAMLGDSGFERRENDLYETIDLNVTDALCKVLLNHRYLCAANGVWEPACASGLMVEILEKYFHRVEATDINPNYPFGGTADFLTCDVPKGVSAIITNPPYGALVDEFIERGLHWMRQGKIEVMAMFARNELDSACARKFFHRSCPEYAAKVVLTWRPYWVEKKPGDAGPRHNYAWYVWERVGRSYMAKPQLFYVGRHGEME